MAKVVMNHGSGGEIMQEFLAKHVTAHFPKMKTEIPLDSFDDSAVVDDVVFTTDGHTVVALYGIADIAPGIITLNIEH